MKHRLQFGDEVRTPDFTVTALPLRAGDSFPVLAGAQIDDTGNFTLTRFVAPALLFAGMPVAQLAVAQLAVAQNVGTINLGCSTATVAGTYAFHITGQILTPAPAAGPVSGVALTTFDGFGNLSQVDNVVHNGIAPIEDWRPAIGTYAVKADCTGTFTFTPQPTVPADASPALTLHFVVAPDGSEIRTVVTSSPNTPPFTSAITSVGIRMVRAF